jgi:type VI protein secretion system component VasF
LTPHDEPPAAGGPSSEDDGLRRMLTWTFAALVVTLVMAYIGVSLAIRFFDRP